MATIAPPTIVIDQPTNAPIPPPAQRYNPPTSADSTPKSKPLPPSIDTTPVPSPTTTTTRTRPERASSIFNRPNSASTTPTGSAACYLCDEQNPGDFSPTTKYLEACLLCNRWFCPIHKSVPFSGCCDINHSTYFHKMLGEAHRILNTQSERSESSTPTQNGHSTTNGTREPMSPTTAKKMLEGRDLAEVLIQEGIYPSLGEREKAIFTTSPVDERKQRELESFRSLDAAVMNGGQRGKRVSVQEMDLVGADVAV